jgi:hypothetical protein
MSSNAHLSSLISHDRAKKEPTMLAALLITVIVVVAARGAVRLLRSVPRRNADFGLE